MVSLAITSGQSDHPTCRPVFREDTENGQSYISLKEMIHPCVTLTNKKNFIPNDTLLDNQDNQSLLLVTGPNMGGKSTLLRQTALAAILA